MLNLSFITLGGGYTAPLPPKNLQTKCKLLTYTAQNIVKHCTTTRGIYRGLLTMNCSQSHGYVQMFREQFYITKCSYTGRKPPLAGTST